MGNSTKMLKNFGKSKNSVITLSNTGMLRSTPQLTKQSKNKNSANIIIKGGTFTTKASVSSSKQIETKKGATNTKKSTKKEKSPQEDLMEKLLSEITGKYKPKLCKDQAYLQRLEKKTMIQEIQMLAQALISCDRAQKKQHENNEKVIKRLQSELIQSED